MKRKVLVLSRFFGLAVFYSLLLFASVFLTMSYLIKGEEMPTPDFIGKSLNEAYKAASQSGVYLKKISVNYDKNYKPLTVINQSPVPGVKIKAKSLVQIYVTSEIVEVIVPELTNYNVKEAEKILRENDLKKRYVTYMDSGTTPSDLVISQSYPSGSRVPRGLGIDLLVSKGEEEKSYVMPDIIGMRAAKVLVLFENRGLKISKITEVMYPDLEPGIVINQQPLSGHRINTKNLISIEVSR